MKSLNEIAKIVQNIGVKTYDANLYQSHSVRAQTALDGRTHYVTKTSLGFHNARVVSARDSCSGLVFWIIESTSQDMHNTKRGFRAVAFDLWGDVLYRPKLDELVGSKRAAEVAYYKWANDFDVGAYYIERLKTRAERMQREASELLAAAKKINEPSEEA
jgi:hypothetical protein